MKIKEKSEKSKSLGQEDSRTRQAEDRGFVSHLSQRVTNMFLMSNHLMSTAIVKISDTSQQMK